MNQLRNDKKRVLEYIKFGQQNPKPKPYAERSTCRSHKTKNFLCNECNAQYAIKPTKCKKRGSTLIKDKRDWFNIDYKPSTPLLHFEIDINRELTFILNNDLKDEILEKTFMTNYGFYNLSPKKIEDTEVIAGILNSTYGTMIMEFGGRYIENRDGTISNETRVSDLEDMLIIDPERINEEQRKKIVNLVVKIGKRDFQKI